MTPSFHFAAESHVDRSIYEPASAIETNIKGTFILLQAARNQRIKRFLHVSTDEVYGDILEGTFADENSRLLATNPYSASKASADLLVLSYVRTFGLPALVTRSSNNYGPYQFPEKFVPLMIINSLEDKPLPIYGDGKQQRDWLHVEDNCRAILAVLQRGRVGEVYNVAGRNIVDNLVLARHILQMLGKPVSLLTHVTDRPGHDRRYAMNCEKITSELGWTPDISLEEGLRQTIEWYQRNLNWLTTVGGAEYRSYYERYHENRYSALSSTELPRVNKTTAEH